MLERRWPPLHEVSEAGCHTWLWPFEKLAVILLLLADPLLQRATARRPCGAGRRRPCPSCTAARRHIAAVLAAASAAGLARAVPSQGPAPAASIYAPAAADAAKAQQSRQPQVV